MVHSDSGRWSRGRAQLLGGSAAGLLLPPTAVLGAGDDEVDDSLAGRPVGLFAEPNEARQSVAALVPDGVLAKKEPVDWTSIALLAVGLGSLQTFLEEGYSDDWFDSPFITTMAILSLGTLVLSVVRQLRAAHPVVGLRVLRYRSLWSGSILSVVIGMALYGAMFAVPIFASSVRSR